MTVERLEPRQCQYCQKVEDPTELISGPVTLCVECLARLNEIARFPGGWSERTDAPECPSCNLTYEKIRHLTTKGLLVPSDFDAKLLVFDELTVCNFCLYRCNDILDQRNRFLKEQAPECSPEECVEPDCEHLRIRNALRCLKHQFAWGFRNR